MKHLIIFGFSVIFFVCCKTITSTMVQKGVFVYKYEDESSIQLILNADSSFNLSFSYRQGCNGKWTYISKDTIFIKCQSVDWTQTITRGYMNEREQKIKVLNENKLKMPILNNVKMSYVILERVDSLTNK